MISPKAEIGKNCKIAATALIHDRVVLGDDVVIEDYWVIGYPKLTRLDLAGSNKNAYGKTGK